ncbi:MAG TPA: hypothetical protein VFV38_22340 [Ktedonobacteraceae bacterium]|nr:hypothetical protein [Ktedonobacteraceae bacterium]
MTNHLMLEKVLLELGQDGTLIIFSGGHSVRLLPTEVQLVSGWLRQLQGNRSLETSRAHFEIDKQGNVRISNSAMKIHIGAKEVARIRNWLGQRF